MKIFAMIASVLGLGLGIFCVFQGRKLEEQKVQTAALQQQAAESALNIERLEASQKQLEEQRSELLQQAEELATRLQTQSQARPVVVAKPEPVEPVKQTASASAKADGQKGGLAGLLKTMMSDPDTRKFVQEQQRIMSEQLYAPFTKQVGMTPDEAAQFKNLVAENMVKAAEKATSMLGAGGGTNRAEVVSQMASDQKSFEEQVKAFLGDSRYEQYKDYQLTLGERAQLATFKQQSQAGEYPITDQQTEQLLGFIREEKQNLTAAGQAVPGSGNDRANTQAMLSEGEADKLIASQETLNQRVYARASTVLSPEQMQGFARFQTNQVQMLRLGFSMARKFLSPDQAGGETAPSNR